jgi:hypothetical protein
MKRKSDSLVSEFFEKISWELLEKYPQIVKEMIRGKAGLYALYNGNDLYYVGLAVDLHRRLKQHITDRHGEYWNRFSVYLVTEDEHTKPLESLVLRIANPEGNRVEGKLPGAVNKRKSVGQQMKDIDANVRAKMMGGSAVKRLIKAKVKVSGTRGMKGVVERSHALRAEYKGEQYRATLRKDGLINYQGALYSSPTAAAKEIIDGRAINGRTFWKYKNDAGEWVALSHLIG